MRNFWFVRKMREYGMLSQRFRRDFDEIVEVQRNKMVAEIRGADLSASREADEIGAIQEIEAREYRSRRVAAAED